jgi:hypothetical protein
MTRHRLRGRSEDEILWFRRRSFLQAAAAWSAMGSVAGASAQQRGNVLDLRGDALVNGQRLEPDRGIQTGDSLETGPGSHLVFVIGNSAFLMRENSQLVAERGSTLNTVSVLRLLTGAVASVWGGGTRRQIVTPTLAAGIRGTGTYTEVLPQPDHRSYFCNCYGTVDLGAGSERIVSQSEYHQSFFAEAEPVNGRYLTPARAINHTDEELEFLARLVNQRTAWQIAGKKGEMDGSGYMPK